MPHHRCAWGTCNVDSRYKEKDYMKDVTCFKFPKPNLDDMTCAKTVQCLEWIRLCGRPKHQLNVEKINNDYKKYIYYYRVCSKVFITLLQFH